MKTYISYFLIYLELYVNLCHADTEKRFILNQIKTTADRLAELETKIGQLSTDAAQFQNLLNTFSGQLSGTSPVTNGISGAVFTRWGKSSCPNNDTMVYSGYIGGSYFNHAGAAPNVLCFPQDPIMGAITAHPSTYGYVYGSEYETTFFGSSLPDENVPCSVCISQHHYMLHMLPGRNKCYDGWTEQYHGYLAGNYYGYKAPTEYICMDENPDVLNGGKANQNGVLFYGVISGCGTLPCPPYLCQV